MNDSDLRLTIFISFLGAIGKDIRALAYDYTNNTFNIYGYLDREPIDADYETIDIAVSEIMASYPHFQYQNIKLVKSNDPIGKLASYKGWIFIRHETQ